MDHCFICTRRDALIGGAALLGASLIPGSAFGRQRLRIAKSACGVLDIEQELDVDVTEASPAARAQVRAISDVIGLPANFDLYETSEPRVNAFAQFIKGKRVIVYGNRFMSSVLDERSRNWPNVTVLAHEIGHHLSGHTLDDIGSRPPRELEADHFAGLIVRNLGGNLANAQAVYERMSIAGSQSHPPRRERLIAVSAGWRKADAKLKGEEERHNLITHDVIDGAVGRVVAEFVGRDKNWTEFHQKELAASFRELARENGSIFLYDKGRSIWVRIDVDQKGGLAAGWWARGAASPRPTQWIPLDPQRSKA